MGDEYESYEDPMSSLLDDYRGVEEGEPQFNSRVVKVVASSPLERLDSAAEKGAQILHVSTGGFETLITVALILTAVVLCAGLMMLLKRDPSTWIAEYARVHLAPVGEFDSEPHDDDGAVRTGFDGGTTGREGGADRYSDDSDGREADGAWSVV